MVCAVAVICRLPFQQQIDFYDTLSKDYDVFFITDSNNFYASKIDAKRVHFFYIPDATCKDACFGGSAINGFTIKKEVTAWDKAFYFFSIQRPEYNAVWFLEDDVFVPVSDTLSIWIKYDVLSAPIFSIVEDPHWPLWKLASLKKRRPLCPSRWWRGMVCGVRLSKHFLEEVKRISEKNGVLYFIEIMIPSFAHGGGSLTHKCILSWIILFIVLLTHQARFG